MPVIRRSHSKPPNPSKAYYFEWWFACPKCKAIYMVEDAKRFFNKTADKPLDLFAPAEESRTVASEPDPDDDGVPPWD